MGNKDWKTELKNHFENVRILEKCQGETVSHFDQFREFIAEPAFEALTEELLAYNVKSRYVQSKGRDIRFVICFPGSKEDQFFYRLSLPKNSVELRMSVVVKARKTPKSEYQAKQEYFMPGLTPLEILKLEKDDIILDVLERYRDFSYEALTSPE